MAKRRIGPLIPTADGNYTAIFEDGSTMTIDQFGTVKSQDDSPNPMRAALMGSGNTEAAAQTIDRASAEDARRFDAGQAQQKASLDQTYKLAMMQARTQEQQFQITSQYQAANIELAKQRLQFEQETSGRDFGQRQNEFNQNMGQRQNEFNTNTGLAQAGLAKGMIDTSASLSGADKVFEAYDLNRGYGSMQETPGFLEALRNNTRLRDYGQQGGAPAPKTIDSVIAKMQPGYAQSAEARTTENALGAISDIATAGAHKLAPGSLEQLNDDELGSFLSGVGKTGFQRAAFLSDYRRSRPGQGLGTSRAA